MSKVSFRDLEPFLFILSKKIQHFVSDFINSLPENEVVAINNLFKNRDEYSEMIFSDIIDKFLEKNKNVEEQILIEIRQLTFFCDF